MPSWVCRRSWFSAQSQQCLELLAIESNYQLAVNKRCRGGKHTQFLKFLSGEVDILEYLRPEDYRQAREESAGKNFSVINLGPSLRSQFLSFNQNTSVNPETGEPYADQTHVSWFRQRDFRRAVSHAVDRRSMVRQFMDGRGLPL